MSEHSRNDPCWCGSGKKYKKYHCLIEPMMVPRESGHLEQTGLYLSHRGNQNGYWKEVQPRVQD